MLKLSSGMKRAVLLSVIAGLTLGDAGQRVQAAGTKPVLAVPHITQIVHVPIGTPMPVPGQSNRPVLSLRNTVPTGAGIFRMTVQLQGWGFQAHERVTISTRNVFAPNVVKFVGTSGTFTAQVTLTWTFCGAHAMRQPVPLFAAVGDRGSVAQVSERPAPCPQLLATQTGGMVILAGYGFASGERLTVSRTSGGNEHVVGNTTADVHGYVHEVVAATADIPCGTYGASTSVVVRGPETAAATYVRSIASRASCPVHVSPGTPAVLSSGNTSLALSLSSWSVRPGQWERILVQSGQTGVARIVVSYANGVRSTFSVPLDSRGAGSTSWMIPSSARRGLSRVHAVFGNISLTTTIQVQ